MGVGGEVSVPKSLLGNLGVGISVLPFPIPFGVPLVSLSTLSGLQLSALPSLVSRTGIFLSNPIFGEGSENPQAQTPLPAPAVSPSLPRPCPRPPGADVPPQAAGPDPVQPREDDHGEGLPRELLPRRAGDHEESAGGLRERRGRHEREWGRASPGRPSQNTSAALIPAMILPRP